MIKLIKPVFYFSVFCATQLSAMLDPQSLQILPENAFGVVTYHCTLESLGRLKTTNKHFNGNVDIDNIIKNPLYYGFSSVEKYLYHHAPMLMQMQDGDDKQKLQQLLSGIIAAHTQEIKAAVFFQYMGVKAHLDAMGLAPFDNFVALDKLVLDEQKRLLFYCGKLPGRPITTANDTIKENSFPEKNPVRNVEMMAKLDALKAARGVLRNISRLKVILKCYEQFPTEEEGGELFEVLCENQEYSDLVINYISLPDRGFDYTGKRGCNAYKNARHYGNQQLINALELGFDKAVDAWLNKK